MDDPPTTEPPNQLSEKISRVFGDLAIDKRRLPMSHLQRRGIPSYVAEWVLDSVVPGQGPLSAKDAAKVQEWAERVVPGPDDQNKIKFRLQQGETLKILTPLQVEIVIKRGKRDRVAQMGLLGIDDAHIPDSIVATHEALLYQGMWGVVQLIARPEGIIIVDFKPMQATVDLNSYKAARKEFTLTEWRSLILLSMGYAPEAFGEMAQSLLLCRLLPLVQKNMHLIELAPKGTGKSYVFENISPRVKLISGGNVSPAVLFVNNATGQWGVLARYAVVVLDEVQTLKFDRPEEIVGGLKGYLANARLTRGGLHESASDCGLVLLANIALDDNQCPVLDPVVQELPKFLQETAFLDRLKGLIPGWQIDKLSGASFANAVGLKADYFGDVLLAMREDLHADHYCARRVRLRGAKQFIRNEKSIQDIASGLMKILYPDGEVEDKEFFRECILPARRLRQHIWNQLYTLDSEYRQYEPELECELV